MVRKIGSSHAACLTLGLALLASPRPARSEPTADPQPLAQALFAEGRTLLAKGRTEEACSKFAESHRLYAASGTLLNLGLCHEQLGKLASAYAELGESVSRAIAENRPEREKLAREHLTEVSKRVSRIAVLVPAGNVIDGMEVRLDGALLGRATWGVAAPVDPGRHVISATAPRCEPWSRTIDVRDEQELHRVEVPRLDTMKTESPALTIPPATDTSSTVSPPAAPPADVAPAHRLAPDRGRSAWPGLLVGGAGVAIASVGAGFALDASSKWSEAKRRCPDLVCRTPDDRELGERAGASADVATALLVVGGASLVVGAVLFFTAPSAAQAPGKPHVRLTPSLSGDAAGIVIRGSL